MRVCNNCHLNTPQAAGFVPITPRRWHRSLCSPATRGDPLFDPCVVPTVAWLLGFLSALFLLRDYVNCYTYR